ncbi:glutamate racemase [Campylobacter sp.]|uniref:glutamate racemase n=1 Tax=Campylobacter sp. TaxID=205 RepID=UPI0027109522|nr:glutamate racemase [Campylobacter sp.]
MKIGVFDSGLGGLSVLKEAIKKLPNEQFLYYADKDNVPYGLKSKEEILKFTIQAVKFMQEQGVKAIVIACNTATSAAINELRANFSLPIIGMEPAVKKAVDSCGGARTLVIATPITVKGKKLQELIKRVDNDHLVDLVALPELVKFAENEEFNSDRVKEYLKNELLKFDLSLYSSLVLGCTHFNYFKDSLREILASHIKMIDGNEGTVNKLKFELERLNLLENLGGNVRYYYSAREVKDSCELARIDRYLARLDRMLLIE